MQILDTLLKRLPVRKRANLMLRLFAFRHVRLIGFIKASVEEIDDDHCVVGIPLNRRTKNHLGSQYFGAMMIGADLAGGLLAFHHASLLRWKLSLAFKEVKAEFFKRAEGRTLYTCTEGPLIREILHEAAESGERINRIVRVIATTPKISGTEPVAAFEMTLSVRVPKE